MINPRPPQNNRKFIGKLDAQVAGQLIRSASGVDNGTALVT